MDDPDPYSLLLNSWTNVTLLPTWWEATYLLIIIVILLVFSALISGSEVAYFSLTPSEREDIGSDEKNPINELLDGPRSLLGTILVANNFINILIVILCTYAINQTLEFSTNKVLEFIIQVVLITFLLLLFGEVIPKVYATRNGLTLARFMAYPLLVMKKIFYPVTFLMIRSTSFVEKRINWKGKSLSSEDLSQALELTAEDELKDEDQKILEGIVKFGNTDVKQIMISRVDVISIENKANFKEVLDVINENKYSRIPVFEESFDQIVGTLYIKDLLPYLDEKDDFDWIKLVRKPFFVPENKKIDDLLKEFQELHIHLAIVVDEYGGSSGIVTLDDILEQVVEDISEEYEEDDGIQKIDQKNYLVDGKTPLIDIYKVLELDPEPFENAKGESDTLAGFVIEISGRIPKKMERFEFENVQFTVESANVKRIKEVKITLTK